MSMPALQTGFEAGGPWADALKEKDILNTGGGWLQKNTHSAFLENWWNSGGEYMRTWTFEQRILSSLLAVDDEERRSTLMLEDAVYNSPRSPCIVHLYAEKKVVAKYRRDMARTCLAGMGLGS